MLRPKIFNAIIFSVVDSASICFWSPPEPLMILMNMYSPLVWEHHGVFLVLSFFVLLRVLDTPGEWTWFGVIYFIQFLIPTFDFFPWSYARMLSPLLLLWLMWRASGRPGRETPFFTRINQWLQTLPPLPALS